MQGVIYIDILILINSIISYFLIKLCIYVSQKKTSALRLCFASLIAGLSSLTIFLPFSDLLMIFVKLLFAAIIIFIAFNFINIKLFLKMLFTYIAFNIAFGGLVIIIISLGANNITFKNYNLYIQISPILLVFCILFMYLIIQIFFFVFDKFTPKERAVFEIKLEEITISGTVLLDTGMRIKDAIMQKSVVLCSFVSLNKQLPKNYADALLLYFEKQELSYGLWLINVKTALGMQMLPAILAKNLHVKKNDIKPTNAKQIEEIILVFTNEQLADGSIDMLINPSDLT